MICFGCPVRKQCQEYRTRTDSKHGIWGGQYISEGED